MNNLNKCLLMLLLAGTTECLFAQQRIQAGKSQSSIIQSSKTKEMESLNIVNAFLTAVQTGDHEKVNALVAADIHWEQPGNNRFSGTKSSLKEVYEMVGGMSGVTNHTLKLASVRSVSVNGNSIAAVLNWKATKPSGEILDVDNIDVYTVKDGKIVNAIVYSADIEKEDKYWMN
jgi:ketosteroid isomerase-like protein